ncbi:MAG: hypothetical protein PWQ10_108 [Patescibacteria group bacterium]|nr:hypothetical protein [Patescibacteria group bacterium]
MNKVKSFFNLVFSHFTKFIKKRRMISIILLITILIVSCVVVYFVFIKTKADRDILEPSAEDVSTIAVETSRLDIKEWGISLPVNNNILGDVSYKVDDYVSITFSFSNLNSFDFAKEGCTNLNKDSWGLFRVTDIPSESSEDTSYYRVIDEYTFVPNHPGIVCDSLAELNSAYSFMVSGIKKD